MAPVSYPRGWLPTKVQGIALSRADRLSFEPAVHDVTGRLKEGA